MPLHAFDALDSRIRIAAPAFSAPAFSAPAFSAAVSSAAVAASDKELRAACCASRTYEALERSGRLQLEEVDARELRTAKALSLCGRSVHEALPPPHSDLRPLAPVRVVPGLRVQPTIICSPLRPKRCV